MTSEARVSTGPTASPEGFVGPLAPHSVDIEREGAQGLDVLLHAGSLRNAIALASPADLLCLGGLALAVVATLVLLPLSPLLLEHPLAHLLLSGSTTALVTGGAFARVGTMPLPVVIASALFGLAMFDPFYWWAGRRYGDHVARTIAGRRRDGNQLVSRCEGFVAKYGLWAVVLGYFLPVPNTLLDVAVGASGVSFWRFALADLVGTTLWGALLIGLGWSFGATALHVVHLVAHDATWASIGLLVLIVGVTMLRHRRAGAALG